MVSINRAVISRFSHCETVQRLRSWLPDGRLEGNEYVARNPTRLDRRPGSFKINVKTGAWADFATGDKGGDLVSLHAYLTGVPYRKAATGMQQRQSLPNSPRSGQASNLHAAVMVNEGERSAAALQMWQEAVNIEDTPATTYFARERGLNPSVFDISHALRWHWGSYCICGKMTDVLTNADVGVHRTFLDRAARKVDRRMLGRQGVIRLSANEEVQAGLGVTEGLEDGLALLQMGWRPVWVATCASAIAKLPVLSGIEALTIFADADTAGRRAASICRTRWIDAGSSARVVSPGAER